MLLKHSLDSKKGLPAAIALLTVGLLLVTCGMVWQHAIAPVFHLSNGRKDFLHGFSIGLGLTLEVLVVVMLVRMNAERGASGAKQ